MILENVSGDFSIEINQRYVLVMFPTMAFLAGFFVYWVGRLLAWALGFALPKGSGLLAAGLVCVLVVGYTANFKEHFIAPDRKGKQTAGVMYNRNHLTTEEAAILGWLRAQPEKPRLFIYSRPWHFIGYGYSARHYSALNEKSLADWLKKYNGEVYYVRGLDCWDSKTYHEKAVERRIPTVCENFEEKFATTPVFQEVITNNYLVTVAKITGMRSAPVLQAPALPEGAVWLSDLAPASAVQSWGSLQKNQSVGRKAMRFAGKRYAKGIGVHSQASVLYQLDSSYTKFSAVAGLDENEFCGDGVGLQIFVDSSLAFDAPLLSRGKAYPIEIPLRNARSLRFAVDSLSGKNCDHLDLANAMLER
jgi:hypothetical protein